jgi:2-methylcitrate dehydratase PrpD
VLYENFRPDDMVRDPGSDWLRGEGCVKLQPCGRPVHAAIDALHDALSRSPTLVPHAAIARNDPRAFRFVAYHDRIDVRNVFAPSFSTPHALAAVAVLGSHGLECFDEAAASDPRIRDPRERATLAEAPACSALFPRRRHCDAHVTLRDGTVLGGRCDIMRGEPGNPTDPAGFERKFFDIGTPVQGSALARRIHDDSLAVDRLRSLRDFAGREAI